MEVNLAKGSAQNFFVVPEVNKLFLQYTIRLKFYQELNSRVSTTEQTLSCL